MIRNKFIMIVGVLVVIGLIIVMERHSQKIANTPIISTRPTDSVSVSLSILDKSRITKKPFGIFISPQHSPVSPERFSGYHTGVDFETTQTEADIDISVQAICNGKLLLKKWASGYGGIAVQLCSLNSQAITVIYGHLKLVSITSLAGQVINEGNTIGILGKGYSNETGGERKHLHLGIHKGTAINILGYVQKQSDLSNWLNPADYVK